MPKPTSEDTPRAPQPLRFSWHAEPESGSFLKWLLPTVLSGMGPGEFDIYREASRGFDEVELTLFVNGIPVDTEQFLEGVERTMDASVAHEALRILQERTSLDAFQVAVDAACRAFRRQLEAAGLELPEED